MQQQLKIPWAAEQAMQLQVEYSVHLSDSVIIATSSPAVQEYVSLNYMTVVPSSCCGFEWWLQHCMRYPSIIWATVNDDLY